MAMLRRLLPAKSRGGAAVEMAILLPILVLFIAVPLYFGRVFWYYSVAQKAAHDAARFLSSVNQIEIRTPGGGFAEAPVAALSRVIAQEELMAILPATEGILIDVQCDLSSCGTAVPTTIRVVVKMLIKDKIFDAFTSEFSGSDGLLVKADVTMRYVGN